VNQKTGASRRGLSYGLRVSLPLASGAIIDGIDLRVIDEDKSEPDGYLYPAGMFAPIELPVVAKQALMAAGN
jgi:hypothetical protein